MKLRNKKTGEIIDFKSVDLYEGYGVKLSAKSLAEFNVEWEDAPEEPKQWYGLNAIRDVGFEPLEYEGFEDLYKHAKELGIAFETEEEAEKAVEKLKAFKRLKDKGFRFDGVEVFSKGLLGIDGVLPALKRADNAERLKIIDDLDLLFCAEVKND